MAAYAQLRTALERQRAALLAGDLAALPGLERAITRNLNALGVHPANASDLENILEMARHNAALIKAAQRGVATVRQTLAGTRDNSLTTYARNGHKRAQPTAPRRLQSRL